MYTTDTVSGFSNGWETDAREEFYVTIAYDGFGAGHSALKLYEHLQEQFGADLEIHREIRPFTMLRREEAQQEAEKKPDMIIVASHRAHSLPAGVLDWLSGELGQNSERPQALVALVNMGKAEEPTAIYQQLAKAASEAGASFFHHPPGEASEEQWIEVADPLKLEKGWGLNE